MDDAKKHFDEGLRLYELGRYEEAIEEFDKALAIDPNYEIARNNKESALKELKRFKKWDRRIDKGLTKYYYKSISE